RLTCGVPERYGMATPGTGGVAPHIDWDGGYARVANTTFEVQCKRVPANAAAVLVLGAGQANVPVIGVNLLVDLSLPFLLVSTAANGSGVATVPVGIPNSSALGNQSLYAQWLVQDAGGPQGVSASRGSKITICP